VRFLTDENVARLVLRTLREEGHDVLDVVESRLRSAEDDEIIRVGIDEGRIIITHDKDFGGLLTYPKKEHGGVILLRLRYPAPVSVLNAVHRVLVAFPGDELHGRVTVVEDTRIRMSGR
jgi:predicted nuclease of predicted toxin-antitoxin system